ncbi:MAG: transcription elongation factor GreA [Clostridia bacterium]|nr:transcription elongation factor GreA [Clostridia bacterium]
MEEKKLTYTAEGFEKLKEEYDYLKNVRRQEVKELLKEARSFGDLSENSEYDEARDQQAKVESRIAELEYLMKNAVIIDTDAVKNVVSLGSTVILKYADGTEKQYDLVGSNEVDPLRGKISDRSPIGMAIIGHKKGENVTIETPAGERDAEIVDFYKTK